jgi:hypothetical protein
MNEQLQNTVNEVLLGAVEQAAKGAEFLKGQLPDVVQQLLMWNLVASLLMTAICSAGVIAAYLTTFKWADQTLDKYGRWKEAKVAAAIGGGIAGALLTVTAIVQMFNALKIWIAPKVWLIEYAASLVKGT